MRGWAPAVHPPACCSITRAPPRSGSGGSLRPFRLETSKESESALPALCHFRSAATNHPQIGIREFDHPCRMCRQFCLVCLAQVLAVACVLPSSNNVFGFHDSSPFFVLDCESR